MELYNTFIWSNKVDCYYYFILIEYSFYTDLEFLIDFMNTFLYSF